MQRTDSSAGNTKKARTVFGAPLVVVYVAAAVLCFLVVLYVWIDRMAAYPPNQQSGHGVLKYLQSDKSNQGENAGVRGEIRGVIESLKIAPEHATPADALKVSVNAIALPGRSVSYRYSWSVNGKTDESAQNDIFPLSSTKRGDTVTVTVTPIVEGSESTSYAQTLTRIVNRVSPDLTMMANVSALKEGKATFQLVGSSPDGSKVTYALEPPLIAGMSVDKDSGLITWVGGQANAGAYRFAASAIDMDGTKIIKTFDVEIKSK